ncbi:MAG: hypothetical protein ACFE9Z_07830 [Promethearchaeota archaeon]
MIKEFHNGNQKVLWSFGEQSAQISLNEQGYLNAYIKLKRTPVDFINSFLAHIWTHYFVGGTEKIEIEGDILHVQLLDFPKYHPYLELTTMGYIKKALELVGITIREAKKIESSAKEIYYQFTLDL